MKPVEVPQRGQLGWYIDDCQRAELQMGMGKTKYSFIFPISKETGNIRVFLILPARIQNPSAQLELEKDTT